MRINKHGNSILKILGDFISTMTIGMLGLIALGGIMNAIWMLINEWI